MSRVAATIDLSHWPKQVAVIHDSKGLTVTERLSNGVQALVCFQMSPNYYHIGDYIKQHGLEDYQRIRMVDLDVLLAILPNNSRIKAIVLYREDRPARNSEDSEHQQMVLKW